VLKLDDSDKSALIGRLRSVHGHIGGVVRMVEEDAYCIDVLHQIQAVQSALDKASEHILESHLNTCVVTAVQGEDLAERERVLREVADVFRARRRA
jgi:DNA-binding FrmR family transcriptional regulator